MNEPYVEMFTRGLRGTWSHPDPVAVIEEVDYINAGKHVEGFSHSIWQITRHILGWGWQMLNKLKSTPVGADADESNFFPREPAPESEDTWKANQKALKDLIDETSRLLSGLDPEKRFPEWDNISAADVLMILATHNSYHVSKIVELRKALSIWQTA